MKKVLILAGFASALLSCNNQSGKTAANGDTVDHSAHHNKSDNTGSQNGINAIKETMDKMMQNMHTIKATGNNDVDFATMMVEHHKGAVEMAKIEIAEGSNTELKAFAQKVIDDQHQEIEFMEDFIAKSPKTASSNSEGFQKALHNSMMAMMNDSSIIYNNVDKDFATQMIPHHQSAVDMAKAYLELGQEKSLRTLCHNIINSQTKEINWLKEWLSKSK